VGKYQGVQLLDHIVNEYKLTSSKVAETFCIPSNIEQELLLLYILAIIWYQQCFGLWSF
jgi:hypothetical protein